MVVRAMIATTNNVTGVLLIKRHDLYFSGESAPGQAPSMNILIYKHNYQNCMCKSGNHAYMLSEYAISQLLSLQAVTGFAT